jgi:isoleucyl-tRNA synthetase
MFEPVPTKDIDFPALERAVLRWWYDTASCRSISRAMPRASSAIPSWTGPSPPTTRWASTTLGGEPTKTFTNDSTPCSVTVNAIRTASTVKDLGRGRSRTRTRFTSKRDIEAYGIDRFVEKCKERVFTYSAIQTEQSKRLGYFMDWDNSYYTLSDENNYVIWHFLKVCHQNGWIYHGYDVMPWCPRCATGLSEMEVSEGYKEITHLSLYVRFPLEGREREALLVWTPPHGHSLPMSPPRCTLTSPMSACAKTMRF